MDLNDFNEYRNNLNNVMKENDDFFSQFGNLDDEVYSDGAIPKKYKELTGLSISVISKCDECIVYHIQECVKLEVSKQEMIEAIKIAVIGGGSVTYPSARFAFNVLEDIFI